MTQEDRQLLLKDICARLPYGVKAQYNNKKEIFGDVEQIEASGDIDLSYYDEETERWKLCCTSIDNIKPYLRPISSVTEEEKNEVVKLGVCYDGAFHNDVYDVGISMEEAFLAISWLIERHFDINYLINKGLAIEAPEGMYKI